MAGIWKRLKKVDGLVLRAFIGPYLLSFFIAQFVLVMMFLWKSIDDILGKGFGVFDLLELILYFAVTNIPNALPIAILLSSVMVFGNMSERHELSSMKSAGVSLLRIMKPAIYLALATAMLSILASNFLKPQANFQFLKQYKTMKSQKLSLAIEQKIFNKDFTGYAIRVNEKLEDDESIVDVLIYDHSGTDRSLVNLTKAEKGRMYTSEDKNSFVMELENGTSYREDKRTRKKDGTGKKYPFMRTEFKTWKKSFDMSEFDTDDNGISLSRNKEDMLNTFQLIYALDSVSTKEDEIETKILESRNNMFQEFKDQLTRVEDLEKKKKERASQKKTIKQKISSKLNKGNVPKKKLRPKKLYQKSTDSLSQYSHWYKTISADDHNSMPMKAVQSSARKRDILRNSMSTLKSIDRKKDRYLFKLNQIYSFAIICILFLFTGAPLGSIIRKGGYGYPLLFAILFYMMFIITMIMGEKLVRSGTVNPIFAAWQANIIMFPIAVWLTWKALRDGKFEKPIFLETILDFFKQKFSKSN